MPPIRKKCTPTIKTRKKCTSNIVTTTLDDYQKDSTGKQYLMCTKDSDCNGGTCVSPIDQPTLTTEEQDMMDNYCNVKLSCAEAASKTYCKDAAKVLYTNDKDKETKCKGNTNAFWDRKSNKCYKAYGSAEACDKECGACHAQVVYCSNPTYSLGQSLKQQDRARCAMVHGKWDGKRCSFSHLKDRKERICNLYGGFLVGSTCELISSKEDCEKQEVGGVYEPAEEEPENTNRGMCNYNTFETMEACKGPNSGCAADRCQSSSKHKQQTYNRYWNHAAKQCALIEQEDQNQTQHGFRATCARCCKSTHGSMWPRATRCP